MPLRLISQLAQTTAQDIVDTALHEIGPITPPDGHTHPDLEDEHWKHLAAILRNHGAPAHAHDLQHLPHHVVLSPQLQARLGQPADTS